MAFRGEQGEQFRGVRWGRTATAIALGVTMLTGTTAAACKELPPSTVQDMGPAERLMYDYTGGKDLGDKHADDCLSDSPYDPSPELKGRQLAIVSPLDKKGEITVTPAGADPSLALVFTFKDAPSTAPLPAANEFTMGQLEQYGCLTIYEHQPEDKK